MNIALVWVLTMSSWQSNKNEVEMLGPFATIEDCQKIQNAKPFKNFTSECLEVNMIMK